MNDCVSHAPVDGRAEPTTPAWMAVFSLAMGVFGLLTAEYLPASLLTPMALDLGVSGSVGRASGHGHGGGGVVRRFAAA